MEKKVYLKTFIFVITILVIVKIINFPTALAETSVIIKAITKISVCGNNSKEGGEHCDNNKFGGKTCSDLGFKGGTLSCSNSCEYVVSDCTTDAEVYDQTEFTSTGGEFTLVNGNNQAKITLLKNSYNDNLWLFAFSYTNDFFSNNKPAPSGKSFVGKTYDFVFIDSNGNTVSALSKPATIAFTYSEADISGIDENTLAPYRWGADDSSWQLISGATIDTANNTVTFSTNSFSSFALFGEPEETELEPSPGGGGGGGFFRFLKPKPTPKPEPKPSKPKPDPDFNDDGKINIVDLSILLFWYGKTGSEIIPYDLNEDNMIDIADVSILFYYWKD